MACGLLAVSEPISPNNVFTPGEHFVQKKIRIRHTKSAAKSRRTARKDEAMRRAGYQKVLDELSACQVWPRLFEHCMDRDFPRPAFDLTISASRPSRFAPNTTGSDLLAPSGATMRKIAFVCSEPYVAVGFNVIFRDAMELARGDITVATVCKTPVTAGAYRLAPDRGDGRPSNLFWLGRRRTASTCRPLRLLCPVHRTRFYPLEERVVRAAVAATYDAPLGIITEAPWIRD